MIVADIELPDKALADICRRLDVKELSVFGSALREDFGPESDIDFLVVFENNDAGPWASRFGELEEALSDLLGRRADVVDKRAVERSDNYIRRRHILESARSVYVA